MHKLGLDAAEVEIAPYDPEYTSFLQGRVLVTPAYYTGGITKLRQRDQAAADHARNHAAPGSYRQDPFGLHEAKYLE
ncbi:MAG: hypothetical protein K9J81_03535 [Desulfohalobiaceae bacterium]|nr:hypothetical protein [Desulfohalobiaceae bacterium]